MIELQNSGTAVVLEKKCLDSHAVFHRKSIFSTEGFRNQVLVAIKAGCIFHANFKKVTFLLWLHINCIARTVHLMTLVICIAGICPICMQDKGKFT